MPFSCLSRKCDDDNEKKCDAIRFLAHAFFAHFAAAARSPEKYSRIGWIPILQQFCESFCDLTKAPSPAIFLVFALCSSTSSGGGSLRPCDLQLMETEANAKTSVASRCLQFYLLQTNEERARARVPVVVIVIVSIIVSRRLCSFS